jgi:hypothetical protein
MACKRSWVQIPPPPFIHHNTSCKNAHGSKAAVSEEEVLTVWKNLRDAIESNNPSINSVRDVLIVVFNGTTYD